MSLGMVGYGLQNILSRSFYAEQNGRAPVLSGIVSIAVNLLLCLLLTKPMDVTHEACDEAIALAKEKGLLLGVDFDLHFRGPLSELRNAVEGGFFGDKIVSAMLSLEK